jgi:hypothetical protein
MFPVNDIHFGGTWWHLWLRYITTSQKVVGSIPSGVIEKIFLLTQSLRPHSDPRIDSASNINEYHGYLLVIELTIV